MFIKRLVSQTLCARQQLLAHQRRMMSSSQGLICVPLKNRSTVRVYGDETFPYLQAKLTNDMEPLKHKEVDAVYAHLLNVSGRVLYDVIVYNHEDNSVLVECDKEVADEFKKVLDSYKIRAKVDFDIVDDEYQMWAVLPQELMTADKTEVELRTNEDVILTRDPRLPAFGWRLILPTGEDATDIVEGSTQHTDTDLYDEFRYRTGLCEGIQDIPVGKSIPLECNAVYLNGVSFEKGCFIGQELTARAHHVGVTRKRIMPLVFDSDSTAGAGDDVENAAGKKSGKVRTRKGYHGLGLLRLEQVLGVMEGRELTTKNADKQETGTALTHIPSWWPYSADEIMQQIMKKAK